MGREIRHVPPDWQHPRYTKDDANRLEKIGKYKPLHNNDYQTVAEEWIENFYLWAAGKHKHQRSDTKYYWEWDSPPDAEYYRTRRWTPEEATCLQVYETVSEGSPVTPVFATPEALVEHLVFHGTDFDHGRGWPRENAERFVKDGHAFSMVMGPRSGGPKMVNEEGFYDALK